MFEAADEAAHFLYVHHLLADHNLPLIRSRDAVAAQTTPVDQWAIESHQPPLYYAVGALLISWTDRSDVDDYLRPNNLIFLRGTTDDNHNKWLHSPAHTGGDTHISVMILRGYSIVLGMGTLWFVYRTGRLVLGAAGGLAAMLLVASIPTFVSISASINNDNLVTFLYSAGVYWVLSTRTNVSLRDALVVGLILSAIALTKLTGVSLFVIVYGALLLRRRGEAAQVIAVSLVMATILAVWWYLRNWDLYGDPLALGATRLLWGREYEIAATSGDPLAELVRIGRSFWLMVGHLHNPVYGPAWVYAYAAAITLLALFGTLWGREESRPTRRDGILAVREILLAVCMVVGFMLLAGTRSVDISYGRLLFPALVGFAPLMVAGWRRLLGRRLMLIPVLPLTMMTLLVPFSLLPRAYPLLIQTEIHNGVDYIGTDAGGLELVAYTVEQNTVRPGDTLTGHAYLRGTHPQNPALFLTAVDSLTGATLGHTEIYPGMAPTDTLPPERTYRFDWWVDVETTAALSPRLIDLHLSWYVPDAMLSIPQVDGSGVALGERVILRGPVLIDSDYQPRPENTTPGINFHWDDVTVVLEGYTIRDGELKLYWRPSRAADPDWVVAVQVVDADGNIIAQADGPPASYPPDVWQEYVMFEDTRRVDIPAGAEVLIGWYRQSDFMRASSGGAGEFRDRLYVIQPPVP